MVADRWRQNNIFLLGDAAHLTPPFIGQGMGAGLRDAHNLAWKLAGVITGTLPPHALDSYEVERKAHATAVIKLARLMGVVMTKGGRAGDALRGVIAPTLPRLPGVRARVLDSETKPLTANRWISGRRRDRLAGTLIPNHRIAGQRFDELNRDGLTIVALRPVAAQLAEMGLSRQYALIEVTWDHDLGSWLRDGGATAAIVRPDSTVLASSRSARAILNQLATLQRP
jgi:3-(3-hydroxy-phenyl)propionate hydroxylase